MCKKWLIVGGCSLAILLALGVGAFLYSRHAYAPPYHARQSRTTKPTTTPKPTPTPVVSPPPVFNKAAYSTTDPSSQWVIVNKQHPMQPLSFAPPDLVTPPVALRSPNSPDTQVRQLIVPDLQAMFTAAATAGSPLMLSSGYRSYNYQVAVYGKFVKTYGQAQTDTFSARPGFSEHQTGLVLDIGPTDGTCDINQCFGDTAAGKWLAAHAYEYGFIMRYPSDKVSTTGYTYEPWHFRYVGRELAAELHKQGIETLEEFFGVSGGETYLAQ